MPPLFDAVSVYLAKPPLYKVTQGRKETYIEKEAELEDLLLGDKWEKFSVLDRSGTEFKLTETRWQKYTRLLKQYEGWASSLRADYGHEVVTFLEESQVLDEQVQTAEALEKLLGKPAPEGEPFDIEVLETDPMELVVRAVERKTGLAQTHRVVRSLFESNDYRQFLRVHHQLLE